MDISGGVPEPLLPPQIALQNPELVGGELFHVLPRLGLILVMLDSDGDENYVPHVIPIDGGFPEPLAEEAFAGGRSHLVRVDDDAEIAFFSIESREESVEQAVRVDLPTRAAEVIWESRYGAYVAAWTPDHSRVALVDGYTMGDVVLYEIDEAGSRRMLYGTPIEDRDPDATYPPSGFRSGVRHAERRRHPADHHALRRQGLARISRSHAAGRDRADRDRRARARGRRRARGSRPPRRRSLLPDVQHRRLLVGVCGHLRRSCARILRRPRSRRGRRARRRSPARAPPRRRQRCASSRRSARQRHPRRSTCFRPTTRRRRR